MTDSPNEKLAELTEKRVKELCKQFGSLYINSVPNVYPGVLLDIAALCELALTALEERSLPARGMVMVPREPTPKMLEVGAMEAVGDSFLIHDERQLGRIWSEMIAASQEKPE